MIDYLTDCLTLQIKNEQVKIKVVNNLLIQYSMINLLVNKFAFEKFLNPILQIKKYFIQIN